MVQLIMADDPATPVWWSCGAREHTHAAFRNAVQSSFRWPMRTDGGPQQTLHCARRLHCMALLAALKTSGT